MMCDECHKSLVNSWCLVRLQEASDTLSDATDTCTWSPMDEDSPPETSGVPEKHKKDSSSSDSDETELKRMKTNISDFSEYKFWYSEDVEDEELEWKEENNVVISRALEKQPVIF